MSEESRKDEILELSDNLTATDNGSGENAPAQNGAENSVVAGKPPVPSRPPLKDIPMARISFIPASSPPPAHMDDDGHDELFELQEGHVVEEGDLIPESDSDDVDGDVDMGTPEMVFDDTVDESSQSRDARLPDAAEMESQPKHAVPVNQPLDTSGKEHRGRDFSSFMGAVRSSSPAASVGEAVAAHAAATSGQPEKRISVEEMAAAVFDTDLESGDDDGPRESTLDNYVGYMNQGDATGPAMASPEEMFPGAVVPAQEFPSEASSDDELDIDITEEVEEVVDGTQTTSGGVDASGVQKPPPPPPPGGGRPVSSFFKNDKIDAANAALKLAAKTSRKSRTKKREWWATIFDDEYLMLLPERSAYEQQKQIDFIQRTLGLPPGALLLDLACGNGRNSIGMAQRNYRIVGVDLSLSMLARAGDAAQEAGQKINFIHGDMRDLGFDKTFDGVFSMDTSFGYFDEPTNMRVLQGIYRALKPGGTFLLELANRDFVIRQQPNMVWFQMDNMVCMEETDFNYINNRLYISRQLIIGDNSRQSKHEFSLRLYSLHEIGQLLHQAGFAVVKVSGHRATPGAFFGPESSKLIIVAERRGE
ncbi:MAG: class I SAM-dependent methyltransferase [Deltaproteobacteria bacterium]|nr:class I SAM-dependent methyltransferase [Deltaproteobacteria bacterium]